MIERSRPSRRIEALPIGEFLVQRNKVDALLIQHVDRGLGRFRGLNIKEGTKDDFQRIAWSCLIVDDQDGGLLRRSLRLEGHCHMLFMYPDVRILSSKTYSFSAIYA